jgi:hypothetical protein
MSSDETRAVLMRIMVAELWYYASPHAQMLAAPGAGGLE